MKIINHQRLLLGAIILLASAFQTLPASQEWAEDIQHYRSAVFEADNSYTNEEREQAEALLTQLENDFASMSNAQIELALAKISAMTNNGHSFLMPGGWTHRYARLPIRFYVFADGIYVISATTDFEHLRGHKLVSIEGHPAAALSDAWAGFQGGLPGWRNIYLPYFLETPEILHAAGMSESPEAVEVILETPEGESVLLTIGATADLPPLEGMDQYIAPSRTLRESIRHEASEVPLYLRSPGQTFRFEMLDNPKTAYVQFKANVDFTGSQDIDAFIDSVFGQLRSSSPQYIILDERFNFGGDLNITRDLMKKLPEFLAVDGRLYIITSGRTFSAGISSAGYAKEAAGDRAMIVGEPVGDSLEFWAEGDLQVLPNSGVTFLMATERHNYQTGCPENDCHGSIKRHPIKMESLQPEIPAPLNYSDFEKGIDPSLEAIQAHILENQ